MASPTLSVLSSPDFPQVLAEAINRAVDRVLAATSQLNLIRCDFVDEYCNCRQLATVHHLLSEQEFCLSHFQAVSRG